MAILDKKDKDNVTEILNIIGDVKDKTAIIVDDIVDTKITCGRCNAIKKADCNRVVACITHPVLSAGAVERIEQSTIEKIYIGDTISSSLSEKFHIVSVVFTW